MAYSTAYLEIKKTLKARVIATSVSAV